MSDGRRWILLVATACSWNVSAQCRVEATGTLATTLERFHAAPPLAPAALGFTLADLQGMGTLELVQGGLQRGTNDLEHEPAITVLSARERAIGQRYRTRASLKFEGEYPVAAYPMGGALFGVDGPVVVLVTRAKHEATTRVRLIDGSTWKGIRRCDVGFSAITATVAPGSVPGSRELYLQDASSLVIHSLPDLQPLRTLPSGGGAGFVLAQLDEDPPLEAVIARTPGLVLDTQTGEVEWEFAAGFGLPLISGAFGPGGEAGFATFQPGEINAGTVNVFETRPYSLAWTIPTWGQQALATRDIDGDGREELFVGGSYPASPTHIPRRIRAFDTLSRTVRQSDEVIDPFDIMGMAVVPNVGATGFDVLLEQDTAFRSYPLGAPESASAEYAERGPFAAFALVPGALLEPARVVFINSYSWLRSLRVHVLDEASWEELSVSPMPYTPGAVDIRHGMDVVSLRDPSTATPRVAIGGHNSALAVIDPFNWSSAWSFGLNNVPSPLVMHTPERLAVVDFNRDGVDDILVGAGMWSSWEPGARLALFDGRDGVELWRSAALGGNFAHVRDIQIQNSTADDPVALVSGTFGVSAFAILPGSVKTHWSLPIPANAAAFTSDDGWLVAAETGTLFSLNEDRSLRWENGSYFPVQAVQQPRPGGPILAATGDRLRWFSLESGAQIGVSAPVGSSIAAGNRWKISLVDAAPAIRVVAGGDAGLLSVVLAEPPHDAVFVDSFE